MKMRKIHFILGLTIFLGIPVLLILDSFPKKAQAQNVVELACPSGQYALSGLTTRNPNTGGIRQYGCVDANGNLSLANAVAPGGINTQLQYNNSGAFGGLSSSVANNGGAGNLFIGGILTSSILVSSGSVTGTLFLSAANCASSASPAVCGTASSGSVAIAAGSTTLQVNTADVGANSEILLTRDDSLGTRLSVTCNTATVMGEMKVSARTNATNFTITVQTAPVTNPGCIHYSIVNF